MVDEREVGLRDHLDGDALAACRIRQGLHDSRKIVDVRVAVSNEEDWAPFPDQRWRYRPAREACPNERRGSNRHEFSHAERWKARAAQSPGSCRVVFRQ